MIEIDEGMKVLSDAMQVADQAQRRVAKALKPFGLTPGKLNYLKVIKHIGGPRGVAPQEIAKRLLIDASNVTHYLDSLERRGWVIRLREGPDRRWRLIRLTPQGDRLLEQVRPVYDEAIRQLTSGMPEICRRELAEIFKEWRSALEG